MLSHKHATNIGKAIKRVARLRGGGSALPGLVVEKLQPRFLQKTLSDLPYGVVIVSGTNGKTTTTKMLTQLLEASGLRVFTNKSGSNFTRGVIASLLGSLDSEGKLEADIAVLELDEAHATHFIKLVPPRYSLLLNVMRDQLDRFGEIDHTAGLLRKIAESTREGVVLNRDDPLVRHLADTLTTKIKLRYFGLDPDLKDLFPSDHDLYGSTDSSALPHLHSSDVILKKLKDHKATFAFGKASQKPVTLKINGVYNVLNAAAALATVRLILGDKADAPALLRTLEEVRPAFGRGEALTVHGQTVEIVLVKNPAGFRLALTSYVKQPATTMIAINDNYADGRDMSWLWDVDFSSLESVSVVSGVRAYDMALRLQYEGVEVVKVTPDLSDALDIFLSIDGPKRIYCTYTAMLRLRKLLGKQFSVEAIE